MLFNTWTFAIFLAAVFLLNYLPIGSPGVRAWWQIAVLTSASFIFYGWAAPWLLILLVAALLVKGYVGWELLRDGVDPRRRKVLMIGALVVNIGALAFFKYAHLIAVTLLPAAWVGPIEPWLRSIPLPVGISFYTFQGLSLILDAYWGKPGLESLRADAAKGKPFAFQSRVWFFTSFFPQLVAGPIVKAVDFVNQVGPKYLKDIRWYAAVRALILGFFLKMVVADNLKEVTAGLGGAAGFAGFGKVDLLLMLYAYSFQIFADFAGYSAIALGLAYLFGYRLVENFNFPYIARSMTEFWRRWHISLSTWLRDYLYIPLGGNRVGPVRVYANLFLVMFLGGLWHGAAWSYAIWGTAHGVLLALERAFGVGRVIPRRHSVAGLAGAFFVFNAASFLWLLFCLPQFGDVVLFFKALGTARFSVVPQMLFVVVFFAAPVVLYHVRAWVIECSDQAGVPRKLGWLEHASLGLMLFMIAVNSGTSGAFIYFQF